MRPLIKSVQKAHHASVVALCAVIWTALSIGYCSYTAVTRALGNRDPRTQTSFVPAVIENGRVGNLPSGGSLNVGTGAVIAGTVQTTSASGPTWTSGTSAPSGVCSNGSLFSVTSNVSPGFYVCAASVWIATPPSGSITGSLTAGTVPVANGPNALANGSMTDDGTSVTVQGLKPTGCTVSSSTLIVNLTIPAGCTFAIWTPSTNADLVGVSPPAVGSRHLTIYVNAGGGANFTVFPLNSNATTTAWQIEGNISGSWLSTASPIYLDYDTTTSKWVTQFSSDVGAITTHGSTGLAFGGANTTVYGNLLLDTGAINFIAGTDVLSSGNQTVVVESAGTGAVQINSGTGNPGTGGLLIYSGGSSSALKTSLNGDGSIAQSINLSNSASSSYVGLVGGIAGTFNTTSAAATAIGLESVVTSTVGTGANALENVAAFFTASGATANVALQTDSGDLILNRLSGSTRIGSVGTTAQYTFLDEKVITTTATFTPKTTARALYVQGCGAGGGGGGAAGATSDAGAAGGGGAGGLGKFWLFATSFTGGTATIAPAASGGAAGNNVGATGGSSSVVISSSTYTFGGGTGGAGAAAVAGTGGNAGGAGGTTSGLPTGAITTAASGDYGMIVNVTNTAGFAGRGGISPRGTPGVPGGLVTGGTGAAGGAASGFCAGGAGGIAQGATSRAGGNSAPGVIIIDEYE